MDDSGNLFRQFLAPHFDHAIERFRALLAEMESEAIEKALLTTHPDYAMEFGIAGTERGYDALKTRLEMVPAFESTKQDFKTARGLGDEWEDYHQDEVFAWVRAAWVAAGGLGSGRIVVLLENNVGDDIDLSTGEPADPALGFNDM